MYIYIYVHTCSIHIYSMYICRYKSIYLRYPHFSVWEIATSWLSPSNLKCWVAPESQTAPQMWRQDSAVRWEPWYHAWLLHEAAAWRRYASYASYFKCSLGVTSFSWYHRFIMASQAYHQIIRRMIILFLAWPFADHKSGNHLLQLLASGAIL